MLLKTRPARKLEDKCASKIAQTIPKYWSLMNLFLNMNYVCYLN